MTTQEKEVERIFLNALGRVLGETSPLCEYARVALDSGNEKDMHRLETAFDALPSEQRQRVSDLAEREAGELRTAQPDQKIEPAVTNDFFKRLMQKR
jgi:hypothetical protein